MGNYRILKLIGAGGFGVVYAAEHNLLGRRAAIKLLRHRYSEDPSVVKRFFNEARAITRIKHDGLAEVYDFGFHEGQAYLAMELLDGESLAKRLAREQVLPVPMAVELARQVAAVLAAAHRTGVIHRDLKPENIYLVHDAEARFRVRTKLLDFGIAKLVVASTAGATETGTVLGTPLYMSPEQCRSSGRVDARSDIYSLGCVLHEMLVGEPPFNADGFGDLLLAHMQEMVPPMRPRNPTISPMLETVVQRMLAKSPADRPQTANALIKELDDVAASFSEDSQLSTVRNFTPVEGLTTRKRQVSISTMRRWLLPATAAVVVGGGGATLMVSLFDRPGAPKAALVAPAGAPAAPTVVERPRRVRLRVASDPVGAEVLDAATSQRLGLAPLELDVPAEPGERRFVLRLAGHVEGQVSLAADRDGTASAFLAPSPSAVATPTPEPRPQPTTPSRPRRKDSTVDEDGTLDWSDSKPSRPR